MLRKIMIFAAVVVMLATKSEPLALCILDILLGWIAIRLVIRDGGGE